MTFIDLKYSTLKRVCNFLDLYELKYSYTESNEHTYDLVIFEDSKLKIFITSDDIKMLIADDICTVIKTDFFKLEVL